MELIEIARINSRLLESYKGQTIRLTAKVIKLNGETATVEASDGGQVCFFSLV
jgi:replication factor A3